MARPRAVPDSVVYATADRLRSTGADPTPRAVGEALNQEYGAAPSFTTLIRVLKDWRRLQQVELPEDLPADFVAAIVPALKPLFGVMTAQAAAELRPQLIEAQERQAAAEATRAAAESDRARLEDEIAYLRGHVAELVGKQKTFEGTIRELTERASKAESSLATATATAERIAIEAAELKRELAEARTHAVASREQFDTQLEQARRELTEARAEHAAALQEREQRFSKAQAAADAELQERNDRIAALMEQHTKALREVTERLTHKSDQLTQAVVERDRALAKAEEVQREVTRLAAEGTRAKATAEIERAELRERVRTLESQLNNLMEGRNALDQRYELLLERIGEKNLK